eukprot:2196492-Amphidinium_carterae.1
MSQGRDAVRFTPFPSEPVACRMRGQAIITAASTSSAAATDVSGSASALALEGDKSLHLWWDTKRTVKVITQRATRTCRRRTQSSKQSRPYIKTACDTVLVVLKTPVVHL